MGREFPQMKRSSAELRKGPGHYPRGQKRPDGCAHDLADRGSLKPDLCLQARQSSRGHLALRSARFPRRQDGESHSRRTDHGFQEMAHLPELKCPGERGWLSRMWMESGFNRKDGRLRNGSRGPGDFVLCPGARLPGRITWGPCLGSQVALILNARLWRLVRK